MTTNIKMPNYWILALKQFNHGKNTWCVAKKGTPENAQVKEIMEKLKNAKQEVKEDDKPHSMYKNSKSVKPNRDTFEIKKGLIEDLFSLTLKQRNEHRKDIYEKYKTELDEMKKITKKKTPTGKKSGVDRNRTWAINVISGGTANFETEDDEYKYIGKFPRGMWVYVENDDNFDEKEQKLITKIAREYGAFQH